MICRLLVLSHRGEAWGLSRRGATSDSGAGSFLLLCGLFDCTGLRIGRYSVVRVRGWCIVRWRGNSTLRNRGCSSFFVVLNFIEYEFVYIYSAAVELGETTDEDVGEFFLCLRVVGEVFGGGVLE